MIQQQASAIKFQEDDTFERFDGINDHITIDNEADIQQDPPHVPLHDERGESETNMANENKKTELLKQLGYTEGNFNFYVQLHREVMKHQNYNRFGARIPIPTKMNLELFENLLQDYHDKEVVEWMRFGWPTGYPLDAPEPVPHIINHKGALLYPNHIDEYFKTEIKAKATIGPFIGIVFQDRVTLNPLNSRPKRTSKSKRRIILDLSFPKGTSVNDHIPKDSYLGKKYKLTYPTVDTLAKRIHELNYKCKIYRVDEERSFWQNPLDPIDYGLIGMHWKGLFFWDINSPQGLRTGAMFCQRCTNAIRYIMNSLNYFLLNYLDDLHGCETEENVWDSYYTLIRIMRDLRRDIAHDKTTLPTEVIEVLGIWFDVRLRLIAISPDRIQELLQLLNKWRFKEAATKKDMQRLIGKLQFAAKCLRSGRIFISRLLKWMHSMRDDEYRRINQETRKDIRWWMLTLHSFKGTSLIWYLSFETPDVILSSDANLTGCGAHSSEFYFHILFPEFVLEETTHVAQRELITIAVTLKVFTRIIRGKKITFYCDNQASVACVNSGRTKDEYMLKVLREIAFLSVQYDFLVRTKYLDTRANRPADILSRWDQTQNPEKQFLKALGKERMVQLNIKEENFKFSNDW